MDRSPTVEGTLSGDPVSIRGPRLGPLWGIDIVAAETGLCWATRSWFGLTEQVMVYVVGVLVMASRLARRDAAIGALLSVAALDFFFVPPAFAFRPTNLQHVWTLAAFLITSLVVSSLALGVRRQAAVARERERRMEALYAMGRALSGTRDSEGVASIAVEQVRDSLGRASAVFLPGGDSGILPIAGAASDVVRSDVDRETVVRTLRGGLSAEPGTGETPNSGGLHLPLSTGGRTRGVLSVAGPPDGGPLPAPAREFLGAVAALTAVALDRAMLVEDAQEARLAAETERARSAFLSAISHDLRTPLASLTGALGALLSPGSDLTEDARRRLLESSRTVSERLGRLVTNLLELARVEAGGAIRRAWYPLDELVASAVDRVRPTLEGRAIEIALPESVVQVRVDGVLLEQVLVNLLENAAKHTPPRTPVELRATSAEGDVVIEVRDRGPGIPDAELGRVFEPFRRVPTVRGAEGTGLGLALCRAIVMAHGGSITVENREGGGAVFRVTVPHEDEPVAPAEEVAATLPEDVE